MSAAAAGAIVKSGHLTKRSGGGKGLTVWRRRWFELHARSLHYFKKQGGEEMGFVQLEGCTVLPANHMKKSEFCFQIHHPTNRTYYIFADTADDMHAWMAAIEAQIPSLETTERILYVYNVDESTHNKRLSTQKLQEKRQSSSRLRTESSSGSNAATEKPRASMYDGTTPLRSNLKGRNGPKPKRPLVFGDDVKTEWVIGKGEGVPSPDLSPEVVRETTDPTRNLLKCALKDPDEKAQELSSARAIGEKVSREKNQRLMFSAWVSQVNQEKRIMEPHLFVLLEFEFLLYAKVENVLEPILLHDVPLFDIIIIQSYNPDDMRIEWTNNAVILAATDARIRHLIQQLLSCLYSITYGWPEEDVIDVDISRLLPPIANPLNTNHGAFEHCYKGQCVHLGVAPNQAIINFVASIPLTCRNFVISTMPTDIKLSSEEMKALVNTLMHNSHFTSVSFAGFRHKTFAQHATAAAKVSKSIKSLNISNMGIQIGWWEFGMGLREAGAACSIVHLDISGNEIPEKALAAMAVGLVSIPLVSLVLANCSLSPKAITVLASTLSRDSVASHTLTELDISNNRAGVAGSRSLGEWIAKGKALRSLKMRSCEVDFMEFGQILSTEYDVVTLTSLDISGATLDKKSAKMIIDMTALCTTLVDIKMNDCRTSRATPAGIFEAVAGTGRSGVTFHASNNDINFDGVQHIIDIVKEGVELTALALDETKIKTQGACQLVQALLHCPTLQVLHLSRNFKPSHNQIDVMVQLLVELMVSDAHRLKTLRIGGDSVKHYLGHSLMPLIKAACESSRALTELDVSGNKSAGAVATLAKHMNHPNFKLRTVNFDGNETTLEDLTTLHNALETNTRLKDFELPKKDLLHMAKVPPRGKTQIFPLNVVLEKLQDLLTRNGSVVDGEKEDSTGGTLSKNREWSNVRNTIMLDDFAFSPSEQAAINQASRHHGWDSDEGENPAGDGPDDVEAPVVEDDPLEEAERLHAEVEALQREAEARENLLREQRLVEAENFVPEYNRVGLDDGKDSGMLSSGVHAAIPTSAAASDDEDDEGEGEGEEGEDGGDEPPVPAMPARSYPQRSPSSTALPGVGGGGAGGAGGGAAAGGGGVAATGDEDDSTPPPLPPHSAVHGSPSSSSPSPSSSPAQGDPVLERQTSPRGTSPSHTSAGGDGTLSMPTGARRPGPSHSDSTSSAGADGGAGGGGGGTPISDARKVRGLSPSRSSGSRPPPPVPTVVTSTSSSSSSPSTPTAAASTPTAAASATTSGPGTPTAGSSGATSEGPHVGPRPGVPPAKPPGKPSTLSGSGSSATTSEGGGLAGATQAPSTSGSPADGSGGGSGPGGEGSSQGGDSESVNKPPSLPPRSVSGITKAVPPKPVKKPTS